MNLPPPDPNETPAEPGLDFPGPIVFYLAGPPSARAEAIADKLLAARPGALFVTS